MQAVHDSAYDSVLPPDDKLEEARYIEFVRAVYRLSKSVPAGQESLVVEQLACAYAHGQESGVALFVLNHLRSLSFYTETDVIDAIVPHLDTTEGRVQARLWKFLWLFMTLHPAWQPFSQFDSYLGAREDPPLSLIEIMYREGPSEALLTLVRVYRGDPEMVKQLKWAEHVVSDVLWKQQNGFLKPKEVEPAAVEQLEKLSRHSEWWVRLYVAELLNQEPEFQTPELVKRLNDDNHTLVQKAMSRQRENSGR
jgi:hypothetical protein